MGMDKGDRSQSLSTAYVPVICTVPQEQLDFNAFLIIFMVLVVFAGLRKEIVS